MADLVAERVKKSAGRISAKRLLPAARAAGYAGSPRNFRRLEEARSLIGLVADQDGLDPAPAMRRLEDSS